MRHLVIFFYYPHQVWQQHLWNSHLQTDYEEIRPHYYTPVKNKYLHKILEMLIYLNICLHFKRLETAIFMIKYYAYKSWCLVLYRLENVIFFSILLIT